MTTKEKAIAKAIELTAKYPNATTVQDLYDLAVANGEFTSKDEALAVWGRINRLLPQKNN